MNKTTAYLVAAFLGVFAAGIIFGLVMERSGPRPQRRPGLAGALDLSPDQHAQLEGIWSEVRPPEGPRREDIRRELTRRRGEEIRSMLTEEQKRRFEEISRKYHEQGKQMHQERQRKAEEARRRTMEILTEPQRRKYKSILERRRHRGRNNPGLFGPR